MRMKKRIFLILLAIVFLGGFLRFWQLGQHPVSLSIDELSIGYNAYSILKTAHDEHGQFLPLAFRSVWDYKAPVLIYLMTPAIALLGLNEFGVRFTIAFLGTLTIFFIYLLTKELTKKEIVALGASFSLAISPWHLQASRMTHDAVLALLFLIIGAWLFLRSIERKNQWLWLSAIFLTLSMYAYHAERIVTPFLVLGLAFIFRRQLWQNKRKTLTAIIVGLVVLLPLLVLMLGPGGATRATSVFLSRDSEIAGELKWSEESSGFWASTFNNQPLVLFNFWLKRYLDYWDLNFLFLDGLQLTLPGLPGVGLGHLFEIIPFLLGIWLVFFQKSWLKKKSKQVLVLWLLVGPLAASLANNPQHPLRSLATIPAPQILVGLGGFWLFQFCQKRNLFRSLFKKVLIIVLAILIISTSLVYYLDIYYVHFPIHFSEFWGYGLKQLAQYGWQHRDEYQEIVIDPKFASNGGVYVTTPYLYFLFYGQYDPYLFQNSPRRRVKTEDSVDFDKFTFREIYWPKDRFKEKTLFIGSPWVLPPDNLAPEQIIKEVKFKNGLTGFLIVKT